MRDDPQLGADYLQDRINAEITLARHIGVVGERAGDFELVLSAPLDRNEITRERPSAGACSRWPC